MTQQPPTDLAWYVDRMSRWLQELGIPKWSSVLFVESQGLDTLTEKVLGTGTFWTLEEYRKRFEELVTRGYPWVNFNAAGLVGNELIIDVDWPTYEPGSAPVASVNMSGPPRSVQDKGWSLDGIVTIQRLG